MSVATATLALSLLSQPAAAICVGTTCASPSGPLGTSATTPGTIAGSKASTTGQSGAATFDPAASAGSIFCGGKPAARVSGQITCSP